MSELKPELAEAVVQFRARNGLNQEQFAQMCRVTKQTISNLEAQRKPVSKITEAKVLQVMADHS